MYESELLLSEDTGVHLPIFKKRLKKMFSGYSLRASED
jgi:hypothetical protein